MQKPYHTSVSKVKGLKKHEDVEKNKHKIKIITEEKN